VKKDTFIEIHQVIQSGYNQVKLIGEASRGDSNSYRMSVNVDDERVAEFDVGKYGNFDFQIPLQLTPVEHEIEVKGFGERDEIDVEIADVMGELEERMITLSQMQSTTNDQAMLNNEQLREFIQSNDSVQNQRTSQQSEKIFNDVNSTQVVNSTNEKNTSTQTIFSKHFFSQNVGVLTIIGAVVLIAGAIIALR
jgi:hypothetical protein